ncbi:MAG: FecR domain-containing protein [Cystobacterineae bacterium]|nr:FecR domain-containing protein [Cystobacterineae bacterium]
MRRVVLLGLLLGSAAFAQQPSIPETYVVQPGDTCMGIAKKFFGSASEYPRLHLYNDMGPLPHNHKPGSILRLRAVTPEDAKGTALKSDALLTMLRATVNMRGAKMREWKSAERNQPLFRLDEVHTLSNASADILFRDHSTLQMKQNALIVIYGGSSSKVRSKKAGGVKLLQGELGVSLADLRKPPAEIVTPSVEVSVRATQAIVEVDSEQTSRISVQQGEAKITAQGKSVRLKSGQGIRVKKNTPPGAPARLPSPPTWENSQMHELYLACGTQKIASNLQWRPSPLSGNRYRVEVAQDSQFQGPVHEKITEHPEFPLSELPPGTFYVRMRTLNKTGLISPPSPAKRLDILQINATDDFPSQPLETEDSISKVPLSLALNLPEDIQVFVDGKPASLPLAFQQPGNYLLEFRTLDGQLAMRREVEAMPPKSTLDIHPTPTGEPELWLRFETPVPEDAQLQALGLGQTQVGPFIRQDAQTFRAAVFGQNPHVHVLWGDYPLGSFQEEMKTPPLPPSSDGLPPSPQPSAREKTSFPEYAQSTAILRERRLGSLALPSTYLPQRFQLNTAMDMDFVKEADTPLRLAARVDAPFRKGSAFANLTLVNSIGKNKTFAYPELAIGTQMQFPLTQHPSEGWTAGFAVDLSGNLNIYRLSQETLLRLRAMGTFGYQTGGFSVSTTQGVATEYANSLRAAWIGSISASWRIWPKFLLAAQLDGQKTTSRGFASAAAVGFRLLVGPVELGLAGHAGLTAEGRSQWGDYGASLSLGIR